MENLVALLEKLPERHRIALNWFIENAGTEQFWPPTLQAPGGETFLASKAKGIYKPEWSNYALSVRQTLGGPYPDQEPIFRDDGTWIYSYFQENPDPLARDKEFTNRGLMDCMRDRVPIGVLRQTSGRPRVKYHVLGVAVVSNWDGGFFFLEGFSTVGQAHQRGNQGEMAILERAQEDAANAASSFDPKNVIDGRERALSQIVRRRGQPAFRRLLLDIYKGRCAISGCDAIAALEAAHISPYQGPQTNCAPNGILLRADLHTLFDLGLVGIDEGTFTVLVSAELKNSVYAEFAGRKIEIPESLSDKPSPHALRTHREWAGLKI